MNRIRRIAVLALSMIAAALMAAQDSAAQTWTLTQTATVTDISGQDCGVCPEQTRTQTSTRTYTLPGGTPVRLNVRIEDLLNPADLALYGCPTGPPVGQHCFDRTHATGAARVRRRGMNIKHRLEADAFSRTAGDARITTTASGVGTVQWPGNAPGTPVPGTLTILMNATGSLNATCLCSPGSANADLDVSLSLTPFSRPGGGLPPAAAPATLSLTTGPCGGTLNGPYVLTLTLGPGLQVGDRYSYSFTFENYAFASCMGPNGNHADAAFGDTFDVDSLPGVFRDISFDFDVPDDCRDGNVNSGIAEIEDVLLLNGSAGDQDHEITLAVGQPFTLSLAAAPAGPSPTPYVAWVWVGDASNPRDLAVGGTSIGCTVNPTPFHPGHSPQPFRCLRSNLVPAAACGSVTRLNGPATAPWSIMRSQGIGAPRTFQIQAVIRDDGASNSREASVTNALVLRIE